MVSHDSEDFLRIDGQPKIGDWVTVTCANFGLDTTSSVRVNFSFVEERRQGSGDPSASPAVLTQDGTVLFFVRPRTIHGLNFRGHRRSNQECRSI